MLTESQAAFEIGLWGQSRARSFLQNLLERFGGNVTKAGAANEPPIHEASAAESAASDEQAIRDFNAPDPESTQEKAVQFIFAHSGCLSSDVKKAMGVSDNKWAYTLKLLGEDRRVRKQGDRVSLRWLKAQ